MFLMLNKKKLHLHLHKLIKISVNLILVILTFTSLVHVMNKLLRSIESVTIKKVKFHRSLL